MSGRGTPAAAALRSVPPTAHPVGCMGRQSSSACADVLCTLSDVATIFAALLASASCSNLHTALAHCSCRRAKWSSCPPRTWLPRSGHAGVKDTRYAAVAASDTPVLLLQGGGPGLLWSPACKHVLCPTALFHPAHALQELLIPTSSTDRELREALAPLWAAHLLHFASLDAALGRFESAQDEAALQAGGLGAAARGSLLLRRPGKPRNLVQHARARPPAECKCSPTHPACPCHACSAGCSTRWAITAAGTRRQGVGECHAATPPGRVLRSLLRPAAVLAAPVPSRAACCWAARRTADSLLLTKWAVLLALRSVSLLPSPPRRPGLAVPPARLEASPPVDAQAKRWTAN